MAEFKEGDEVTIVRWGLGRSHELRRVARVTKTFVELDDGSKWSHHGMPYPRRSGFNTPSISLTTDEHREAVRLEHARSSLWNEAERVISAIRNERLTAPIADIEAATAALAKLEVKG